MTNKNALILALDQGTTGSTALLLDHRGQVRGRGYAELPQHFPKPGWVEHDPDARAARVADSTLDQMASGSCSTQPGFGKCCGSSA